MINYNAAINSEKVEQQYSNIDNLSVRRRLHENYSTNVMDMNDWMVNMYPLEYDSTLLELGSGQGTLWEQGRREKLIICKKAILSDNSPQMVEVLKDKFTNTNVFIEQIDIMNIPYEEESFDMVIANSMLYHVADLNRAISEVKRVLKTGGIFFASTFGENGLSEYIYEMLKKAGIELSINHNYSFTLQNGEETLRSHFSDVRVALFDNSILLNDIEPLYDYILSMTIAKDITNEEAKKLRRVLEEELKKKGELLIKKEYGTFIARK